MPTQQETLELDLALPPVRQDRDRLLGQFFTPEWAAQALVEQFFPSLCAADKVIEPSCGRGAFLKAIPEEIQAIGIELDPELAKAAAIATGRTVLCGDFRTIELPEMPTVILGNPPFKSALIADFLARAHTLLPDNGQCGFILPAFALNYPSVVNRWRERFSMDAHLLPRTLFPNLSETLLFVLFTKAHQCVFHGMALFDEAESVAGLSKWARVILVHGRDRRLPWRALVEQALRTRGGSAHLREIYTLIEPKRPSPNPYWKEKIRQVLQLYYEPLGNGTWTIPNKT